MLGKNVGDLVLNNLQSRVWWELSRKLSSPTRAHMRTIESVTGLDIVDKIQDSTKDALCQK